MRIAFTSWTRPALLVGLLASVSAVVFSRLVPAVPPVRIVRAETHILISPFGVDPGVPGTLWLEKDTGRTTVVPLVPGRAVRHASVSPWIDESGRGQIVGRFTARPGDSPGELVGLVRASFPEGRVLDLVPTEVVPTSRPCWYPGLRARVLFAGTDGLLYHHDFDPPASGDETSRPAPRPLQWRCSPPHASNVQLSEPFWTADPRLARIVVVGLRMPGLGIGRNRFYSSRLWWLRISDDGAAIEEAGPLLDLASIDDALEFRSPAVGRTQRRRPALARISRARFPQRLNVVGTS